MRTIVCYGDSNTWGYVPVKGTRYDESVRWPSVMEKELGQDYRVENEGLNARTSVFDDPLFPARNGLSYFMPCMQTNKPMDLLILMLGTNDTKTYLGQNALSITRGMERLLLEAKNAEYYSEGVVRILLVHPIAIADGLDGGERVFDQKSADTMREMEKLYRALAIAQGCAYMDAAAVAKPSALDGIHMDAKDHIALGKAMAERVREIFRQG